METMFGEIGTKTSNEMRPEVTNQVHDTSCPHYVRSERVNTLRHERFRQAALSNTTVVRGLRRPAPCVSRSTACPASSG